MSFKVAIDTSFNFYSDSKNGDPDIASPTLRKYHCALWSKELPYGQIFELTYSKKGIYLYHNSKLGEFYLGSDAITHSYKSHKRKRWLTEQVPEAVNALFDLGSTIGAFIIFPNNEINGLHTINQARGVNAFIDDRFDLTLECIRRFYQCEESPLFSTLLRYKAYFDLFRDFDRFVRFFLLDDLIDGDRKIKFYLPFDNFKTRPKFSDVSDYLMYQTKVRTFIVARNKRIENFAETQNVSSNSPAEIYP